MKLNSLNEWIQKVLPAIETLTLSVPTEIPATTEASAYRSTAASLNSETKSQIAQSEKLRKAELAKADAKILEKLAKVNQKRAAKGQAPLSLALGTQKLESIYENSSLTDKQKKEKIEQLRKQLGLSKGEMKSLFTKRLEASNKNAEKRLAAFERAKSDQLQSELKQVESTHGKDSPQARAVQAKLDSLQSSLEPERAKLKAKSRFFGSVYPGFFGKLGSVFKKIGQVLAKPLALMAGIVRFVPGVGPAVAGAMRSASSLLQGKIKDFGKNMLEVVKGAKDFLPLIPGVGPIAKMAVTGIEAVVRATRGAKQL